MSFIWWSTEVRLERCERKCGCGRLTSYSPCIDNRKTKKWVYFGGSLQDMALKTCLMQQLDQKVYWGGKERKSGRPCLSVDMRDAGRQTERWLIAKRQEEEERQERSKRQESQQCLVGMFKECICMLIQVWLSVHLESVLTFMSFDFKLACSAFPNNLQGCESCLVFSMGKRILSWKRVLV